MSPGDASPGEHRPRWSAGLLVALMLLAVLVLTFLLFYLSGLYTKGVSGRIGMVENLSAPKESWRIVPAAEVDVLITWDAQMLDNFAHGNSRCVRAVMTRTDRDGNFKVGGDWLAPTWPPLSGSFAASHAIKRGYYAAWDYREVAPELGYSSVLGPAPVNPWTGVALEGDDAAGTFGVERCPTVERR